MPVTIFWFVFLVVLIWGVIIWVYRKELNACWREPVLRYPILIFESDDWGPGPHDHAEALRELSKLLESYHDKFGRHPVATLGVVLSVPDSKRINAEGSQKYYRLELNNDKFSSIYKTMLDGAQRGVFSLQLHGLEHYMSSTIMRAAKSNAAVKSWLINEEIPDPGDLPSHLQSRWTDSSVLPSRDLSYNEIKKEAQAEVCLFEHIFHSTPRVFVPPTFVWTKDVERSMFEYGVNVIVTPGRRNTHRNSKGIPESDDLFIYNGKKSDDGLIYVVRDIYFEPILGHKSDQVLHKISEKIKLGRPSLLEMHRFNFISDNQSKEKTIIEVRTLIENVLNLYPDIRFMSTEELACIYRNPLSDLIERRKYIRFCILIKRMDSIHRLRKLFLLTGFAVIIGLILVVLKLFFQYSASKGINS